MANEPKALFEVDAGKILAKLHLAAALQVPNSVVINTGVLNDLAKPDPKNPGDATFDFNNKSGKYEVGVVREVEFESMPFSEIDKEYKTKITSGTKLTGDDAKNLEKDLDEEDNNRKEANKTTIEDAKKEAFEDLYKYFVTFVGKENVKKLNVNNVVVMPYIKCTAGDKFDIKDYVISPIEKNKELQDNIKKQLTLLEKDSKNVKSKKAKDICKVKMKLFMCFKVGYNATLETK